VLCRGVAVAVAVAVAGLTGCAGTTSSSSDGACAAPKTILSSSSVKAGQRVTLAAEQMWDGCNDQGSRTPLPPLQNQKVEWTQNGRTTVLGAADANRQGTVKVTVTVPVTAKAGQARVRVGASSPAPVTVTGP
jgi:hypothetical protein